MLEPHHPAREQIRLEDVLAALGNPLRMTVLQVLANGGEYPCGAIVEGVSKSTLTHHWRVLRESGVINQRASGRELLLSLRRDDLDARFPGLLTTILAAHQQPADVVEAGPAARA
ncbi:helix-turn-helix domain-containing protein [Kribbella sp. NPDC051718]|uniref:ArsR/SmtB family transcription factor n=1 Tax=Kribbella sp. NPDC051718 TaxID=3155168 RepID=UPI00342BF171